MYDRHGSFAGWAVAWLAFLGSIIGGAAGCGTDLGGSCAKVDDCRSGYQCYEGTCKAACTNDASCDNPGFLCKAGQCTARPGTATGGACTADTECSSATCVGSVCVRRCDREPACPSGQTCTLDRDASEVRGYCVALRDAAAPLVSCRSDDECDRGSCLGGACLLLCRSAADCGDVAGSCARMPAPLTPVEMADWPTVSTCWPRNQSFTVDASAERTLLVPETARSVTMAVQVGDYDLGSVGGLGSFLDASGRVLYRWSDANPGQYFTNLIRHTPDLGGSAFLFSSSPQRVPVALGAYPFTTYVRNGGRVKVRAIYKLFDAPITTAKVPLRVHLADTSRLPSSCKYRGLTKDTAPARLATVLSRVKAIYSNINVSLEPVSFIDSGAPSSVDANTGPGETLRVASEDTAGGVDLVLVQSITPNGVLGIAGGIPGSPGLKGTPHTGAVAWLGILCVTGFTEEMFAVTVAHELGHTLGLSHNREQTGQSDPLGDGSGRSESYLQGTANLMYWAEGDNPGSKLTEEQGEVVRSLPQVLP